MSGGQCRTLNARREESPPWRIFPETPEARARFLFDFPFVGPVVGFGFGFGLWALALALALGFWFRLLVLANFWLLKGRQALSV